MRQSVICKLRGSLGHRQGTVDYNIDDRTGIDRPGRAGGHGNIPAGHSDLIMIIHKAAAEIGRIHGIREINSGRAIECIVEIIPVGRIGIKSAAADTAVVCQCNLPFFESADSIQVQGILTAQHAAFVEDNSRHRRRREIYQQAVIFDIDYRQVSVVAAAIAADMITQRGIQAQIAPIKRIIGLVVKIIVVSAGNLPAAGDCLADNAGQDRPDTSAGGDIIIVAIGVGN